MIKKLKMEDDQIGRQSKKVENRRRPKQIKMEHDQKCSKWKTTKKIKIIDDQKIQNG